MATRLYWIVLCTFLSGCKGLQWSPSGLKDAAVVYACQDDNITLPWNVSKTTGETILDIQWFYDGRSQELIAFLSHGHLNVMPAYSGRVELTANAGLVIRDMTEEESGNYVVEINGVDTSGSSVTLRRTAVLQVGGSLTTTDRHLHALQRPAPVYNDSTQEWHAVLTCGTFTHPTHPPFDVEWTTPSGQVVTDSQYKDGQFLQLLDNPVTGGSYTCNVPKDSASAACLHGNNTRSAEASVTVDKVEARLAILEAENNKLKTELIQERQRTDKLEQNAANERISFHARGTTNSVLYPSNDDALIITNVVTNQGNAYNAATGVFVAPKNGTYCFIATTEGATGSSHSDSMELVVDGQRVDYVRMRRGADVVPGSVHAVVRLKEGQRVWLRSDGSGNSFWYIATAFSGFLVTLDP